MIHLSQDFPCLYSINAVAIFQKVQSLSSAGCGFAVQYCLSHPLLQSVARTSEVGLPHGEAPTRLKH